MQKRMKKEEGEVRGEKEEEVKSGSVAEGILEAERRLSSGLESLRFGAPTTHVYNPLVYAWEGHAWYTRRYGDSEKEVLIVGMNPGPWGMAQTGVPFGEVSAVRDWMGMPVDIGIGRPAVEHGKRRVEGLLCGRKEVSGDRFWNGWVRSVYGEEADVFFDKFFVYSYCPLLFLEGSGRNRAASAVGGAEGRRMREVCDEALREVVDCLQVGVVVGVGKWATERARRALGDAVEVVGVWHPSPASPRANRGWVEHVKSVVESLGY